MPFHAQLEAGRAIPELPARVLVPVDFSAESHAALRYACSIASADARIEVIHVWDLPSYVGGALVPGSNGETAAERVQSLASEALDVFLEPYQNDTRIIASLTSGDPTRVVPALTVRYDLVVLGRKAQQDAKQVILGSVAQHVIADGKCPVVTITES